MTATEVARSQAASGMQFDLWQASGNHPDRFVITPPGSNRSPALSDDGRCRGYEGRPALCRTWGMTKSLRCPHGCEPSRWMTDQECGEIVGIKLPADAPFTIEEVLQTVQRHRDAAQA